MTTDRTDMSTTDDEAPYAASIAAIGMGRSTMRRVLAGGSPREAWNAILSGEHPADENGNMSKRASAQWPEIFAARLALSGARVLMKSDRDYPPPLVRDKDGPEILFSIGAQPDIWTSPRVALVGTRAATRYGEDVASELGERLASAGVSVVSGLAVGIDAAAHAGSLHGGEGAPPVAVVATGVDVVYPKSNRPLRDAILERGLVVSELPPGESGERWRFADRNRLIAALSHVVVVVECHSTGGSLYAVAAARARDIEVLVVPGSVRSAASSGTNALLADGAHPARDLSDVLTAVELAIVHDGDVRPPVWPRPENSAQLNRKTRPPNLDARRILDLLEAEPVTLEEIVSRSRLGVGRVAVALEQLEETGFASGERGAWWRNGG